MATTAAAAALAAVAALMSMRLGAATASVLHL
jgi:hypothetical protein